VADFGNARLKDVSDGRVFTGRTPLPAYASFVVQRA
jgi:hypothetical protein